MLWGRKQRAVIVSRYLLLEIFCHINLFIFCRIHFFMKISRFKPKLCFRDSSLHTPSVEEPGPGWEHSLSPRSEKNTLTGLWTPTLLSPPPRYQTPLLNPTMPPSPFTSWLRIPMKPTVLTTKLFMTSASELWNLPPQPTEILITWFLLPCQVLVFTSRKIFDELVL